MLERLLALSYVNPITGCWVWKGYISKKGYGQFRYKGRIINAHRASYLIHIDENLSNEFQIHHQCENKLCINPSHLEPLTQKEHTYVTPNSITYRNSLKQNCPLGHPYKASWRNGPRFRRSCLVCAKLRYYYKRDKSLGLAVPNSWKEYQLASVASSTRG